jgi:predicted secreted Zn-dependent protease
MARAAWLPCLSLALVACAPAQVPQASSLEPTATSTSVSPAAASPSASQLPPLYEIQPLDAPPGVRLTERLVAYPVSGRTPSELRLALADSGLVDNSGAQSAALTKWHVTWAYTYGPGPSGDCELSRIRVALRVITTMPEWDPPPAADPDLVESWEHFENALIFHERGHALNGLDLAAEILAALRNLRPSDNCDRLASRANTKANGYLADAQDDDRAYDRATDHGATQGADQSLLAD